jgi:hypothetical protein
MAAARSTSNELDADDRRSIPDSQYAFGRERKEPLNDARHVRNAIARFDQVQDVTDAERDEAFRRIKRAADRFGVEMTETSWHQLGKPSATRKSSHKPRTPTKARGGDDGPTRDELYAEAARHDIHGRSRMTKAQLRQALSR